MKRMGPRWKVQPRRKREKKTDYRYRIRMLRSGKPRLVVRTSLNHVGAQVIHAKLGRDVVLASAHSKELEKFGWKGYGGNTSAAYLVGLLCGSRAIRAGVKESVLDLGPYSSISGSKVFAALKGALDAGLEIPHDEKVLPPADRLMGKHIAEYAAKLKSTSEKEYKMRFSDYLKKGVPPESLPEHFQEIKSIIEKGGQNENQKEKKS
jgi:large subunit ribosomal protein L18